MLERFRRLSLLVALLVGLSVSLYVPSLEAASKKKGVARRKSSAYSVSAVSAVLMEAEGLKRVYEKGLNQKVPPASTTKVLTALLVLERLKLDAVVKVKKSATNVLPTKIDIKAGESYRVRDLLYAVLLNSANDAAVVLAEAVSGSEVAFVKLMNERARQLGAKHSHFENSHGLPTKAEQFTTAYDMALIFRKALSKPFFKEAISYKYKTITSLAGREFRLKSHNKSLFQGWKQSVFGKTGYTQAAKACFVGHIRHKGKTLIVVVFGCAQRWEDVKYIIERYARIDL